MKHSRGVVDQTRSLMAQGNPVPSDAFGDSWE